MKTVQFVIAKKKTDGTLIFAKDQYCSIFSTAGYLVFDKYDTAKNLIKLNKIRAFVTAAPQTELGTIYKPVPNNSPTIVKDVYDLTSNPAANIDIEVPEYLQPKNPFPWETEPWLNPRITLHMLARIHNEMECVDQYDPGPIPEDFN